VDFLTDFALDSFAGRIICLLYAENPKHADFLPKNRGFLALAVLFSAKCGFFGFVEWQRILTNNPRVGPKVEELAKTDFILAPRSGA